MYDPQTGEGVLVSDADRSEYVLAQGALAAVEVEELADGGPQPAATVRVSSG